VRARANKKGALKFWAPFPFLTILANSPENGREGIAESVVSQSIPPAKMLRGSATGGTPK
jgi:hypothetical protein